MKLLKGFLEAIGYGILIIILMFIFSLLTLKAVSQTPSDKKKFVADINKMYDTSHKVLSQPQPGGKIYNLDSIQKAKQHPMAIDLIKGAEVTNNTAIYKGSYYVVYRSNKDKLFIVVRSQNTNNYYRKYIQP